MGLIDEDKFPRGAPMARELLRIMTNFYMSEREAIRFVARFDVDQGEIAPGLKPIARWDELLQELAKRGTLREAVRPARDEFPRNANVPFLDALLGDARLKDSPPDGKPDARRTAPVFEGAVTAADEALLFRDDLTESVGNLPGLIDTLERLKALARAVCLLNVSGVGVI